MLFNRRDGYNHAMTCLCTGRADIRCDENHCDIAGPGAPGDPNNCRICWLRLGMPGVDHEARRRAKPRVPLGVPQKGK